MKDLDHFQFEKKWTELGVDICKQIFTDPTTQKLKAVLQTKGFLTPEEKSEFIDLCDSKKYQVIYDTYGQEGSEGYKEFVKDWNAWFQNKGVSSLDKRGQRNSVDHILFGSTPDPEEFLASFEQEIPAAT